MRVELDQALVSNYPKIFCNRFGDKAKHSIVYGFECGDGWFDILDNACRLIQSHIETSRLQRAQAIRYNRALGRAIRGDKNGLLHYYLGSYRKVTPQVMEWAEKRVAEDLADPEPQARIVPEATSQIVAHQVKEKFGTLRFYTSYTSDQFVRGVLYMAEAMSAVTCEDCGKPGSERDGSWIRTLCDECDAKRS